MNTQVAVAVGGRWAFETGASPNARQSRALIRGSETRHTMNRGRAVDKLVPEGGLVAWETPWSKLARGAYEPCLSILVGALRMYSRYYRLMPRERGWSGRREHSWPSLAHHTNAPIASSCNTADRWTVAGLSSFPLRRLIQNTERNAFFSTNGCGRHSTNVRRPTHQPTREPSVPIKPNLPRTDKRHPNIARIFAAPRPPSWPAHPIGAIVLPRSKVTTPCGSACRDGKSALPAFAPSLLLGAGSLHRPAQEHPRLHALH